LLETKLDAPKLRLFIRFWGPSALSASQSARSQLPVLLPGGSLLLCGISLAVLIIRDSLLFCCLHVGVAATAASLSEVCIFIPCRWAVCEPMGIGAAVVCTDWLALNSVWIAPTRLFNNAKARTFE
jgi:hypothetical protein